MQWWFSKKVSGGRDAIFAEYFRNVDYLFQYMCFSQAKSLQENLGSGNKVVSLLKKLVISLCRGFVDSRSTPLPRICRFDGSWRALCAPYPP